MNRIWRVAPALVVVALAAGFLPARAQDGSEPVLARVGERSISRSALLRHLFKYYGKLAEEQLIDRALLKQDSARYMLTVSDAEIDRRMAELRRAAPNWEQALKQAGLTEAIMQEQVRYELLSWKVLDRKWPVQDSDLVRLQVRYARVSAEREAKELIREAKAGVSFELLVAQRSLDKENLGLVNDGPFLRVESPVFYQLAAAADLREGQVARQPVEKGGSWLVLKLEKRLAEDTLSGKAREDAVQKIKSYRMKGLGAALRKRYPVEHPVALTDVQRDPPPSGPTVVCRVGSEPLAYSDLRCHLLTYFAARGLEQLIDRFVITQEAERAAVSVEDAEVDARIGETRRKLGESGMRAALSREGISDEAFRERIRFNLLAEKALARRNPPKDEELVRYTARYFRAATQQDAAAVLQAAMGGAPFAQLIAQRSLDRSGDGFVKPRVFLRADSPQIHRAITQARLMNPGDFLPAPLPLGRSWLVIRLEARQGPETLTPAERADAARRMVLPQLDAMLDEARRASRIEYVTPVTAKQDGAK